MAKGQKEAAQRQLGITNKKADLYGGEEQALQGELIPQYEALAKTGYLSPEEEAAATTSEMGAATAPFAAADFSATNRAAASRNPADLTAQQDQLAIEKGQSAGGAAANLQKQKFAGQEAGLYGLNTLESGDLAAMESLYGLGPGTLQARAAGKSVFEDIMGAAGGIAGGVGSAMSGSSKNA